MRKILNIKPEITPTHGDCLSPILYKIFEYKNICDFELLFKDEGHTGDTQIAMRIVGKILEAADLERQANSNIQIALEKLE